jgi:hypothetical protein
MFGQHEGFFWGGGRRRRRRGQWGEESICITTLHMHTYMYKDVHTYTYMYIHTYTYTYDMHIDAYIYTQHTYRCI